MEKRSVRGLSLRGSVYGLNRPQRKKLVVRVAGKASSTASGPEEELLESKTILSVDTLLKELRKSMGAIFCSQSSYENLSQQAFRYFTTTNSITPEAFHRKVTKLGLNASRSLCLELFGRIDQEDLGEISYATFARRIFLPPGRFDFEMSPPSPETVGRQSLLSPAAKPPECLAVGQTQSPKLVRPGSANGAVRPSPSAPSPHRKPPTSSSAAAMSPRQPVLPSSDAERFHRHIITSPRSPRALNPDGIALIYENMSLDEIEKCISQKLEEKTSKGTDRFRQAFRIFTKSEGVTFAEFYHHLELLQIHLSPAKCHALFNRFDLDGNGTIELSEFTAAIFNKFEQEADIITPNVDRRAGGSGNHGIEDFEVEAGSALTIQQVLARLREKLEQHTSKESDRFRQAFKIFQKSSGITPLEFNAAMGKLGLKLTDKQLQELFALFDFDKSGDLDLSEFVQGVMLDDLPTKFWMSVKDRQRLEESRKTLLSMAAQSVQSSWTIPEIEQMLRSKIEQRTSRSSDCFRQAFRIFKKVNGIRPAEFHEALERIGLALNRSQADVLFKRFDADASGEIDLNEFIHGVLPPDYTGSQWVAAADEMHRIAEQQKKLEAKLNPDHYMTEIEMENWSLDEIEKRIRDKIQQATSKSSDTFRQAYKIFKKSNHITIDEFRESLLVLGFRLTPAQCQGLFTRYDTNNSNDIDLQEFCLRILPPDYTGDGDYWSHSEKYRKHKQKEKLEYAKRTRNGLLMLPRFDEGRRYTRGHYHLRAFSDLIQDADFSPLESPTTKHSESMPEGSRTASQASHAAARPLTPRSPRPSSAAPQETLSSPRTRRLDRQDGLTSCTSEASQASPRRARNGERRGPDVGTLRNSTSRAPASPPRPSSSREQASPGEVIKVSSPRRPTMSRGSVGGHRIAELEDDEILEDDAASESMSSAMSLIRAKRRERRQYQDERFRKAQLDFDEESQVSRDPSQSTESVTASSTTSAASKPVGTAKYTPQRNHTLLIKRFLQTTKYQGSGAPVGVRYAGVSGSASGNAKRR
ncbi:hypothetical protein PybrP1_012236 [[Pythium] brassicae (nom. inval.)]|nr:hypothetical protein PybrP1_012236 [[Pythium] brassicae (nom. inval.)]